jgi:transposase
MQYSSLEEYAAAHRARTSKKQSEAKQGEKSRTAVLTESQVRELRARHKPGKYGTGAKAQVKFLKEKYGITMHYRSIEAILRRESWKHIL